MPLALSIIITILVFIIILFADMIHPLLSAGILFMFFMWGLIAFEMTTLQKIFYPLGIVFFIAVRGNRDVDLQTNSSQMDINGSKSGGIVSGIRYHLLSIIIGVVMLVAMFLISGQKGQFLGVSTLATAGTGFGAWITLQFAPAISMALAFIENRMFIAWLNVLLLSRPVLMILIPILAPIAMMLPIIITAVTFGLFHLIAYHIVWKLIWWAAMIMVLWIISYYLTGRDTTAMDTAHGGWNGILTAQESLSIAI